MEFLKTMVTSKTNWAFVIATLAGFVSKYGYEITPELQGQLVNIGSGVIMGVATIYGIIRHSKLKQA